MKKIALLLCLVLIFNFSIIGCQKALDDNDKNVDDLLNWCPIDENKYNVNNLYKPLIYAYSDSLLVGAKEIEYEFADRQKYDKITVGNTAICSVNAQELNGTFKSIEYRGYNYFPVFCYDDVTVKHSFAVDDRGILVSYFGTEPTPIATVKSQDECVRIAKEFISKVIDVSKYDVEIENNIERGFYTVSFSKSVNFVKTTDEATVVVWYNGEIYSYSSFMLGRVDTTLSEFEKADISRIKDSIYYRLDQIYKDANKSKYKILYSEPDIRFTVLKDSKAGAICTVDISCVESLGEYDMVSSERISFVVMLDQSVS